MPKYLDGNGLAYFWGKIKSLFTNVAYHESDDGTSGEASIPSSDANIIEVVKVNGVTLTPDAYKRVLIQNRKMASLHLIWKVVSFQM